MPKHNRQIQLYKKCPSKPYIAKPMRCLYKMRTHWSDTKERRKGHPIARFAEKPHTKLVRRPPTALTAKKLVTQEHPTNAQFWKTQQILKHHVENGRTFAQAKEAIFPKYTHYSNTVKEKSQTKNKTHQNTSQMPTNPEKRKKNKTELNRIKQEEISQIHTSTPNFKTDKKHFKTKSLKKHKPNYRF